MARAGHTIVDVDAHYLEPMNDLAAYMEEPYKSRVESAGAARFVPVGLGDRMVAGRIQRNDVAYNKPAAGSVTGSMSPDDMKAIQQRLGIDAAILVSNGVLRLADSTMKNLSVAFYNAYIDYMLEHVVDPERGLYTMPMLPSQDPEAAVEIIDRVSSHPAVVGACFATSGTHKPLGDEAYYDVYAACERHDLPIVFHGTPGLPFLSGAFPAEGIEYLIEGHSLGFAISNLIQITSILLRGIPEQFPKLKFIFQESGVFWVPMAMYRLDEYYLKRRSEAPMLTDLPSEYVKNRFYFGTQPIEAPKNPRHLEAVFDMIGVDRLLYASDYPHFDYDDPMAILRLGFLSKAEKAAVLGGNAIRAFNLNAGGPNPWDGTSSKEQEISKTGAGSS
jgi:predicted TIM-barrel fold metal-dependent hydrolase